MKTSLALLLAALLGGTVALLTRRRSRAIAETALWAEATDPLPRS